MLKEEKTPTDDRSLQDADSIIINKKTFPNFESLTSLVINLDAKRITFG